MDLFGALGAFGDEFLGYAVPFVFVLSIVVFVHEFGHFLVARLCHVRVLTFSIGFGPELAGFNDRYGTRWRIALIPLGGYVRFFGDEDAASAPDQAALRNMTEEERKVSFFHKPIAQRAAVVLAGPVANFLLAIVIFAGIFTVYGKQVIAARVDLVQPASAAAAAGFKPGDVVVVIDGTAIDSFAEMQRIIAANAGTALTIEVERGGARTILHATPEQREMKDRFGNVHRQGVLGLSRSTAPGEVVLRRYDPLTALWMGTQETVYVAEQTLSYIDGVVAGRESADQVSSVIGIARISGQVATIGLSALINLLAVLSISIGLLNLFPIPMLDGGHLAFFAIEAVRGRPLNERVQAMSFRIGLAIVLMLMLFGTWNDILHLAGS